MIICGLKLTHDGAVAVIKDNKLLFSVELEKINNNPRFNEIKDTSFIEEILNQQGVKLEDIDYFVIDGWGGNDQDALAIQPRLTIGKGVNKLSAENKSQPYELDIALYTEESLNENILKEWKLKGLKIGGKEFDYLSYYHAAGHVLGTYCSSPFAVKNESSYVLVWDGGMYPRLYYFDATSKKIENLGPIFLLIGNIYTIFSQHFGPFKVSGNFAKDSLSVAGKVMAYIALGQPRRELFQYFDKIYEESYQYPMGFANIFAIEFKKLIVNMNYSDEDILCSFHVYMEELLLNKLIKKVERVKKELRNICLSGGCALNIKWNSAIRNSGYFNGVYVPPFPNDSGSAIGMACCAMISKTNNSFIDWSVYSGPQIIQNEPTVGWISQKCTISKLSEILYTTKEPVVFLNGRAEIGPRALGNRSIVADPTSKKMKDILNRIKIREDYRPVSPICIESKASGIFEPGLSDPYMLFDHLVKEEWLNKIPAVIHLDNTARLQTVNQNENSIITELLMEYEKISQIPLLCNTSANYKGCGFFPDVFSATKWDGVNYVWCNDTLYERIEKIRF